ncbi:MAG: protein translocase subunit SecF [Clostridia bacterium]|nr:protein translocase subunit SecF [Clostridia bacterium]MBN2883160.1 protein translocase subunit SecF [Clostridia bacterium]
MIDLMSKRKYFFIFSAVLILIGLTFFFINGGFNWDIQFEGGTIIKIEMQDDNYDAAAAETEIEGLLGKDVTVQKETTFNPEDQDNNLALMSIKVSKENTLESSEINQVIDLLENSPNFRVNKETPPQIQSVAPFIGVELRNKALMAAGWAMLLIVIYVGIRFRVMSGISAALFGIVALLHDGLIMLSVYTVFNIPVNEVFVAAILTIIGYSMNDTIVIYDRIRENSAVMNKADLEKMVNTSTWQSLPRTINTLVTTLLTITTLYIFASIYNVDSIRQFAFPLIVGLTSGSYSSIFIATPLWMMWRKYSIKKKLMEAKS